MAERISNLGYLGLVKEVTPGTALTPTDWIPLYDESIQTNLNLVDQQPIYGNKFKTFTTLQGTRSHKGDITVLAEPNTTARLFDMLLTRTSTTGAGPYTHTFELTATNPNSYTIDISTGNIVNRYYGVQASKLVPSWNKSELQWKVSISALGSFQGREIATVATTTLTLTTAYDLVPNKGLVVGDLVRIYKSATGATLDTTIATVNADGVTVTLAASAAAFAAGDMIYLRPATPTYTLLPSYLWPKTRFKFAATASAATALTTHTPVEPSSTFTITHEFNSDDGEARSGSFDPAALVRKAGNIDLTVKKFYDTPEDVQNMNALTKTAVSIDHLAGSSNQYLARVVFNHLKTDGKVVPDLKADDVVYSELNYHPDYDQTDGKAFQIIITNALPTI